MIVRLLDNIPCLLLYCILDCIHVSFLIQVSWSSEHKKAVKGDIPIKIYDEEGYSAYRKVSLLMIYNNIYIFPIFKEMPSANTSINQRN